MGRFDEAAERLAAAFDRRGDPAAVEAAFSPDARLDRCGWTAGRRGEVVERLDGREAVAAWLASAPAATRFRLDGPAAPAPRADGKVAMDLGPDGRFYADPTRDTEEATVRFRHATPGWTNGGLWRFRLAPDGRVAWLEHRPDDLDEGRDETLPWAGAPPDPPPP